MIRERVLPEDVAQLASSIQAGAGPVITVQVAPSDLVAAARCLAGLPGATFCDLFGVDERERAGCFHLHLLWALDRDAVWLDVVADLDAGQPCYPALTPLLPAAGWYERELRDELGIDPEGHPGPLRLRRPADWPADTYLLRRDMTWAASVAAIAVGEDDELPPLAPAWPSR